MKKTKKIKTLRRVTLLMDDERNLYIKRGTTIYHVAIGYSGLIIQTKRELQTEQRKLARLVEKVEKKYPDVYRDKSRWWEFWK